MKNLIQALLAVLAPALVAGVVACAGPKSTARIHPEEVKGLPQCSDCHEGAQRQFNHGTAFLRDHRDPARQGQQVCEMCHRTSFCADCHGYKEEIKPSDKRAADPGSASPHRGDYVTQHRFDGRVDPAPCFGCHGRKNDWRCRQCHR